MEQLIRGNDRLIKSTQIGVPREVPGSMVNEYGGYPSVNYDTGIHQELSILSATSVLKQEHSGLTIRCTSTCKQLSIAAEYTTLMRHCYNYKYGVT